MVDAKQEKENNMLVYYLASVLVRRVERLEQCCEDNKTKIRKPEEELKVSGSTSYRIEYVASLILVPHE